MNNPSNFDLAAQAVINMDDIACTETDINFDANNSATWSLMPEVTQLPQMVFQVLTEYSSLGRKILAILVEII
ncbi:MAG: hypothetical protein R2772_02850 [Chitinophagales bacterium]